VLHLYPTNQKAALWNKCRDSINKIGIGKLSHKKTTYAALGLPEPEPLTPPLKYVQLM
jgi:hypothetical protein